MRHRLGQLPPVVMVLLLGGSGIAQQTALRIDMTGIWDLDLAMPAGPTSSWVVLEQRGSVLSGDYSSPTLGRHKLQGTITGSNIEISFSFVRTPGALATTVALTGTVSSENEWKGTITLTPGNAGTYSATRRVNTAPTAAPGRDPSPHRVAMVTVDRDVTLEVLDWGGTGRPLVLLAGQGNTAHVFDDFVLRLLPRGTHEYAKFITPSELMRHCRTAGLDPDDLTGMTYNPLTRVYSLGRDVDVNYLVGCRRAA